MATKHKTIDRGGIQLICATAMIKNKITANSKPETIAKAAGEAAKGLGDKDDGRARRTIRWMLRHEYKPATIVKERGKSTKAVKAPAKKKSPAKEQPAQQAA